MHASGCSNRIFKACLLIYCPPLHACRNRGAGSCPHLARPRHHLGRRLSSSSGPVNVPAHVTVTVSGQRSPRPAVPPWRGRRGDPPACGGVVVAVAAHIVVPRQPGPCPPPERRSHRWQRQHGALVRCPPLGAGRTPIRCTTLAFGTGSHCCSCRLKPCGESKTRRAGTRSPGSR